MSYDSLVAALSPWGYWKTDETSGTTLADSSGNSRTLTVFGSPSLAQTGPSGAADAVDWPTTGGACAATQGATTNAGAFTHLIWFKLAANPAGNLTLQSRALDYGTALAADGEFYISSDGKPHFHVFDTAHRTIDGASAVSLNTWHMAAVSVGAAGMKLRIDKVAVASNGSVTTAYTGASQKVIVRGGGAGFTDTSVVSTARPSYFTAQLADVDTDALFDASSSPDATVAPPAATATATAVAPVVSASRVVLPPAASATSLALPPTIGAGGNATVSPPAATATATALAPTVTQIIPAGTDTSNSLNGRRRRARGSVVVVRPAAATPSRAAVKYDKSVPYPPPTLVNGRPT